jgi:hypothetical protein
MTLESKIRTIDTAIIYFVRGIRLRLSPGELYKQRSEERRRTRSKLSCIGILLTLEVFQRNLNKIYFSIQQNALFLYYIMGF